jgi:uncharacterized protein YeaO (DUF488 family)
MSPSVSSGPANPSIQHFTGLDTDNSIYASCNGGEDELPMTLRIVRFGSERVPDEGLRGGTARYPPRGVPKAEHSKQNWYDVWFPDLALSPATMKLAQSAATEREWAAFVKKYLAEMATPPCQQGPGPAGGPLAPGEFIGGLLLRRGVPLPPLGAAGASRGAGREARMKGQNFPVSSRW